MAGVGNAFENSCILTAIGVVAIMINSAIMGRIGRRRNFLMSGLILCAISQLITAVVYDVRPNDPSTGKVIVALAVIFIFGYNVSCSTPHFHVGRELNAFKGHDKQLRMGFWRRIAIATPQIVYIWSRGCNRLPGSGTSLQLSILAWALVDVGILVAHYIYRSVLY